MEDFRKEFVKNKYKVNIVKCCASCKFHDSNGDERIRICKRGYGDHELDYLCGGGWEMEPKLENAGKGGGRVKKKEYIQFIMENGIGSAYRFEQVYGSKYMTS